eukprot:6476466-Prymnesium_polylepis.1
MPQANATAGLGRGLRPGGSVRLALTAPRPRRWAFLGRWCTVQAAEGELYTLSAPCGSHPFINEWVGLFGEGKNKRI